MKEVITTILTNPEARSSSAVEKLLMEQPEPNTPWAD